MKSKLITFFSSSSIKVAAFFWGVTKMMIGKGAPKSLVTRCDSKKNPSQVSQVNQRGKKHGRKIFLLSPLIGNTQPETLCQLLNPKAQLWKQSIEIAMAPKNISVFIMCISFSSLNTQLYKSQIFCLFTFCVFFTYKSYGFISKCYPKITI